jgi:arginine exporter protein ArgO
MTALERRGDTVMVSPGTSLHDENPGVREAILSGLVTGLAIAMPVGAVAALIVALTVRTSFRVGLGAAVGVATVDGAYAAAAVVGGGLVAQVLAPIAQPLRIGSTVVLLAIALWLVVSALRPRPERVADKGWVTTPLRAWMTFVAITAVNPATVIYFAAIVLANRNLVEGAGEGTAFVMAAFLASASWQVLVAGTGALLGRAMTGSRAHVVTGLVSGVAIAVLALRGLG